MPTEHPSDLKDRQGSAYTWGVLMDPRIRLEDWWHRNALCASRVAWGTSSLMRLSGLVSQSQNKEDVHEQR